MRSLALSTPRTPWRMGSYSGRAVSSFCDSALRSRTQFKAFSPCTSSSHWYGSSAADVLAVCDMALDVAKRFSVTARHHAVRLTMGEVMWRCIGASGGGAAQGDMLGGAASLRKRAAGSDGTSRARVRFCRDCESRSDQQRLRLGMAAHVAANVGADRVDLEGVLLRVVERRGDQFASNAATFERAGNMGVRHAHHPIDEVIVAHAKPSFDGGFESASLGVVLDDVGHGSVLRDVDGALCLGARFAIEIVVNS